MTTSYERFEWREAEPGLWTREADEIERFYYALAKLYEASGRKFFFITGHLSVKAKIPDNIAAVDADRYFDIALRKGTTIKEYRVDDTNWVDETVVFVSTDQTGLEWANSDPPAPEYPTLFVIKPPVDNHQGSCCRDLIIRAPHDVIDGIGTLHMFNLLVHLLADTLSLGNDYQVPSLDDAKVIQNLSPPFRVAAAVPPEATEAVQKRLAEMAASAETDKINDVEAISLPYKNGALLPGKHQRTELTLSTTKTSKLLAACKKMGVTVTHAYHAAIAIALREMQVKAQNSRKVQYVNYILRNERERCRPPYNDGTHAATVYHSVSGSKLVIDMTVPAACQSQDSHVVIEEQRTEFLQVLQQMKDFYQSVRNDTLHYALVPHIWTKATPQLPPVDNITKSLPVPPPKNIAQVSISSMGRIDGTIAPVQGPVECYNPWVTGEELGNGFGLFLGTFRGELSLSSAYNDAWHDRDEAYAFLKHCVEIVDNGLML